MRSSSYLWGVVAEAIQHRVTMECSSMGIGAFSLEVYVDDFIFAATSHTDCKLLMDTFTEVCSRWGIVVALDKTFGPTNDSLEVLGILVNLDRMELAIPQQRLQNLKEQLRSIKYDSCTRKELESVVGHIMWVSRVVTSGRAFTFRLREVMKNIETEGFRSSSTMRNAWLDIDWWMRLPIRKTYPIRKWVHPDVASLSTDASLWGYGFVLQGTWFGNGSWSSISRLRTTYLGQAMIINDLEMFTVVIMVAALRTQLACKTIIIECDNMVTVNVINNLSPKTPNL